MNPKTKKLLWRLTPLVILVILMILAFAFDLGEFISYDELRKQRQVLVELVQNYYFLTALAYIVIYIIVTALSIPGGAFLSVVGGFLFTQPWSTLFVVVGATIGATLIFLIAKTALGNVLREKAGPFVKKMEAGFNKNAASYLLFLRFIPIFPFWLVNIAPALFNVKLITYVWTTFIGIIPGAFVFTQAGRGLGAILETGEEFSLETVFNIHVRIALIALAVFALVPVVIKKIIEKRKK